MDLVPGDLVSLEDQSNHPLVCDMILLSGECVVNESSLTGESVPVIKTAISSGNDGSLVIRICLLFYFNPSQIGLHSATISMRSISSFVERIFEGFETLLLDWWLEQAI